MRLRRVSIMMVSLLLLSAVFPGTALAADDGVTLSNIRVNPSSLPGAGTVSVTVHVAVEANRNDGGIDNVRVAGPGVASDTVQEISIGGETDLRFLLAVQASQLGSAIQLTLVWDGANPGVPFEVTVASSVATEPQVSFTRTVDKTSVAKGDPVTLVYDIENTGAVDITNIAVTDEGIPGMTLTRSSLKAGGSAALTRTVTPEADFTSSPKLTYTANGKTYTAACAALTVPLKTLELDALLEASPQSIASGGEVTLLCTLTNTGNVKLTNVTISDKTLGSKLFPAATLDRGTSKQFSRKVSLTKTTTFQYEVAAKDESGNAVTFKSNALEVAVSPAGGQYDVTVSAVPDVLQLPQPGRVNFNITVRNNGAGEVANVTVTDQNGEVVRQFEKLAAGESSFAYSKDIAATTQFNFCLSAPGDGGTTYQVYSGPIEVVVAGSPAAATVQATPSATPEGTVSAGATPGASAGRMGTLLTALLVVGFLIIVTIFVLVAMIMADKRKRGGKKR
jgi:uncharacterized repeat protein (TIGR01451 family)